MIGLDFRLCSHQRMTVRSVCNSPQSRTVVCVVIHVTIATKPLGDKSSSSPFWITSSATTFRKNSRPAVFGGSSLKYLNFKNSSNRLAHDSTSTHLAVLVILLLSLRTTTFHDEVPGSVPKLKYASYIWPSTSGEMNHTYVHYELNYSWLQTFNA